MLTPPPVVRTGRDVEQGRSAEASSMSPAGDEMSRSVSLVRADASLSAMFSRAGTTGQVVGCPLSESINVSTSSMALMAPRMSELPTALIVFRRIVHAPSVGARVGAAVGVVVGAFVGAAVGAIVGAAVGDVNNVGAVDGALVGDDGCAMGASVGARVHRGEKHVPGQNRVTLMP